MNFLEGSAKLVKLLSAVLRVELLRDDPFQKEFLLFFSGNPLNFLAEGRDHAEENKNPKTPAKNGSR